MLSILFVGSFPEDAPNYDGFLAFCRNLGNGVSARHKILVCGTTPRTADHSIAHGAFECLTNSVQAVRDCPRVTLYHTDKDESQLADDNTLFEWFCDPKNHISAVRRFELSSKAFRQAILDCDVVTLIGGGSTSAELVDLAIENQKPVLGFTGFGGTGREANGELKRVYQLLGVSDDDAQILKSREMDPDKCAAYLDLVAKIHRTNPWSSKTGLRRGVVLVAVLAGLVSVALVCALLPTMSGFSKANSELRLYLACISSGMLGSYVGFLRQLNTPSDILMMRATPATGQGVAIGFGIAAFTQMIVGHVLPQDVIDHGLSFVKLIGVASFVAFAMAWLGLRGLKKFDDVLGGIPSLG